MNRQGGDSSDSLVLNFKQLNQGCICGDFRFVCLVLPVGEGLCVIRHCLWYQRDHYVIFVCLIRGRFHQGT